MARKTILSLTVDELATQLLFRIRKRAAINPLFRGIVVPIDDPIGHRLTATGMFEATQIDGLMDLISIPEKYGLTAKPSGIFIDVGANIGVFTIAFANFFERVLAIEASPETFAILQANLLLRNSSNVKSLCLAASDMTKPSIIYVPNDGSLGGATMNPKQHPSAKKVEIRCRVLDDIVSEYGSEIPVGFVKIDVEGHECEVIRGAKETLTKNRPIVAFEAWNVKENRLCVDALVSYGYRRFFAFKRSRKSKGLLDTFMALRYGYDVYPDEMSNEGIKRSPMVCAVA
jgi:FkbM family methyltransferase